MALAEHVEPTTQSSEAPPTASESRKRARLSFLREVLLLGGGFLVYWLGRLPSSNELDAAYRHAIDVWNFERSLNFPSELAVQQWVLHSETLVRILNTYYVSVHFPLTIATVAWLIIRHRDVYKRARFALFGGTFAALFIQIGYPLMPPRMLDQLGFVDTMRTIGPSAYGDLNSGAANQLAAMPSLHVGWAVLCFIAALYTKNRIATVLFAVHVFMTVTVVVTTGNHYWLDGVIGAGLIIVAWKAYTLFVRAPESLGNGLTRSRVASKRGATVSS